MDYMIGAMIKDVPVRIFAADTSELVGEAQKIHSTLPTASAAFGRTLTAAALMTMLLKNENNKISVQIKCDGPIEDLLVVGNTKGEIKGDINNPLVHIPLNQIGKLDVAGAIGKGTLTIIQDLGLKEPYVGTVELVSGEIGEDFSYYFSVSEQTPSVVALGVLVNPDGTIKKAGGYLIQLLPNHSEELIDYIEKRIGEIPTISKLLDEGHESKDIIELIFKDYKVTFTEKKKPVYHCDCNRDRFERGLISLGREELTAIVEEDGQAEILCHFCNKKYEFEKADLITLLESIEAK
ncbi:Hsp33 family molecular chaperone HslO [Alkalibaculum bacchi]|uniref:Hsp33 family molecular chaperone HslO n=1 Tax=Alkalibaculum bacchi TaxID=645887 RepID=UPI0026EEECE4|nr:Hsp33 family molecular chaperone HslO [Alkalibaculum bacchi]